ncbi:MAG: PaaI family thioesterase [Actinomycetota bacterium]|nr:PaaI family thioesterase [Actinomycetota bacterium]
MPAVPAPEPLTGFDRLYGLQIVSATPEEVRAKVDVTDDHKQPFGLVHGGLFASIAESITSTGTFLGVRAEGKAAMGLSNQTSFLRPIFGGTVHAVATRRHKGRSTWVWEVDVTDDDGRLCALVRMTVAVRDAPAG